MTLQVITVELVKSVFYYPIMYNVHVNNKY